MTDLLTRIENNQPIEAQELYDFVVAAIVNAHQWGIMTGASTEVRTGLNVPMVTSILTACILKIWRTVILTNYRTEICFPKV